MQQNPYVKSPNARSYFDEKKTRDLILCARDLIYFTENFIRIQHPLYGSIPFKLYGYQKKLLRTFRDHKYSVALTARQLGKCVTYDTEIFVDGYKKQIGSLFKLTLKDRIVNYLERKLLELSK